MKTFLIGATSCLNYSRRAFRLAVLSAATLLLAAYPASADIATIQVDNSIDNVFTFGVIPIAQVSGPSTITGQLVIETTTLAGEVQSIRFLDGDLAISDLSFSENVDFLGMFPGTFGVTFTGVHLRAAGGPYPVVGTIFDPGDLMWELAEGTIEINFDSVPTGLFTIPIDLATNPQIITNLAGIREGTIDGALNLYLPMDAVSPTFDIGGIPVFFGISATFSTQVVPEVPSAVMLGSALGVLLMGSRFLRSRGRKNR